MSYKIPQGTFPPIDFQHVDCSASTRIDRGDVTVPGWAAIPPATQALFVATSLQEAYSMTGMALIEADAARSGVPVTWMVGGTQYFQPPGLAAYNADHSSNGDDVALEENPSLYAIAAASLPWYSPAVSVEGAGKERNIAGALKLGNDAFWGITWNSHGTDNTSDEGAPWGTFCADPTSYKRPVSDGSCSLVSFEWTARDLTRSFFQNTNPSGYSSEAAFSTDPEDVLLRGGFGENDAVSYERAMIDAYAAAGATQPIVVISQQETADEGTRAAADDPVLSATYDETRRSGMRAVTLHVADTAAHAFSAAPRAVAFPYIPGGFNGSFDGASFTPATIDYHDSAAGMTFISGRTLPDRVYEYADDPTSAYNKTLISIVPGQAQYPQLLGVTAGNGTMQLHFTASRAMHFGIAIWSDPSALRVAGLGVTPAGHAGFVATFDLPAGQSTQTIPCGCMSASFSYSR